MRIICSACLPVCVLALLTAQVAYGQSSLPLQLRSVQHTPISGAILTARSGPIEIHTLTRPDGSAALSLPDSLPPAAWTIRAVKDEDFDKEAVTARDLCLIARHHQGIAPFDAPWQWIAADINRSNTVNTYDVRYLQQLILGRLSEMEDNESWRFIPADHALPCIAPLEEPFPNSLTVNWPARFDPAPRQTMVGIRIGDVNATANQTARPDWPPVAAEHTTLEAGSIVDLAIGPHHSVHGLSLQFALAYDPERVALVGMLPGDLMNLNPHALAAPKPGLIAFCWYDVFPQEIPAGKALLHLRVRTLKTVRLDEIFRFASDVMPLEAYGASEQMIPFSLYLQKEKACHRDFSEKNPLFLSADSAFRRPDDLNEQEW